MSVSGKRIARILLAVLGVSIAVTPLLPSRNAYAAQITNRSLTLQAGATDGGSKPGGIVKHLFSFTLPTSGTLGSIVFLYCDEPGALGDTCTPPTGLDVTSASYGTSSGAAFDGVVTNPAIKNRIYLTRATPTAFTAGAVTEQLVGVTNPNDPLKPNLTFYVRIATYASSDTTGSPIDTGTVAAATANQIALNGIMPESLIFCTGTTINTPNGIPDCSSASGDTVNFDRLFSPTDTSLATSLMAASTNAGAGYVITVNGATMSSGGNTIQAMDTADVSTHGKSQFGMNLMANTTPTIGTNITPAPNGTNYKGQAETGYNVADHFKFTSTDAVADSQNGGPGPSDAQVFTASYIVNVPGSQAAGQYATTLTYICTATF